MILQLEYAILDDCLTALSQMISDCFSAKKLNVDIPGMSEIIQVFCLP